MQYLRPADGGDWRMRATTSLDAALRSEALGLDVPMAGLYALVLPADEGPPSPRRP